MINLTLYSHGYPQVTFAAGLAVEGIKPFCAIYSTFLQRAYDQLIHDVALQKLPVSLYIYIYIYLNRYIYLSMYIYI